MRRMSRRTLLGSAALGGPVCLRGGTTKGNTPPAVRNHPLDGIQRENIKITDLKVSLFSAAIPPERQWYNPRTMVWKTDVVLVQVFTDQGIVGIGEADVYGGPEEVKRFAEEYAKPALVGQNPFDVEYIAAGWARPMSDRTPPVRGTEAWGGIDCALWDIIGKAKRMPVYRLLAVNNEPKSRVRLYASGGDDYAWYKRPEDLVDEATRCKEEGYTAFKFRVGTSWEASEITVKKFIPLVRKVREAVGPDFDLMLESNMRLSFEECLELAPLLEELKFLWFEEPVSAWTPDAIASYITIRKAMPHVMVSGGEHRRNRFEYKHWIDRGAFDIVQPDCSRTGLTEGWHIARMAQLKKQYCCPHNWGSGFTIMANASLAAAVPNRLLLEINHTYSPLRDAVLKEPFVFRKGYIELPDKPGFGVEVASDLARKYPYLPGHYSRPNPDLPSQKFRPTENW